MLNCSDVAGCWTIEYVVEFQIKILIKMHILWYIARLQMCRKWVDSVRLWRLVSGLLFSRTSAFFSCCQFALHSFCTFSLQQFLLSNILHPKYLCSSMLPGFCLGRRQYLMLLNLTDQSLSLWQTKETAELLLHSDPLSRLLGWLLTSGFCFFLKSW